MKEYDEMHNGRIAARIKVITAINVLIEHPDWYQLELKDRAALIEDIHRIVDSHRKRMWRDMGNVADFDNNEYQKQLYHRFIVGSHS